MTALAVADGVRLPVELVTESSAILAKKGAGKTNAAIVLLEEVYAAGVPVVSIDPKGDHWGVRAGADGKAGGGLPILVFGGRHGDIPLEPTAGVYIADLVRERRLSVVLDVSEFTVGERARFLTAFADRLYRRPEKEPMLLVLEEAHEYIPQMVRGEDAKMVGAFERLVKLGRHKGLGVLMVTQRSSSLNKNVLTQSDNLFVLRTTAPQDRAAVKAWLDSNAEPGLLDELSSLRTGECILVQPERGDPLRFQFRMRHTYDAGATPKVGEKPRPPATLADIDLGEISAAMADTIEKAKAEDPKELRKQLATAKTRVAELEAELAKKPEAREIPVEVPVLTEDDHRRLSEQTNLLHQQVLDLLRTAEGGVLAAVEKLAALAEPAVKRPLTGPPRPGTPSRPAGTGLRSQLVPPRIVEDTSLTSAVVRRTVTEAGTLPKAQRLVLTVLAQRGEQTQQQVAMLTGYAVNGGGFNNALGALRSSGFIEGGKDRLVATELGLEALGEFEPMPTGQALIDFWLSKSGKAERLILEALIEQWPNPMDRDVLADLTGYAPGGGGFNNAIGRLRTLTLIHGDRYGLLVDDSLGEARDA